MDREPAEARFCAECNCCHSAEEGDLWAESSMLGLRITYFACMDGKVYDITGEQDYLLPSRVTVTRNLYFPSERKASEQFKSISWMHFYLSHVTCSDAVMFQSGQVAKE